MSVGSCACFLVLDALHGVEGEDEVSGVQDDGGLGQDRADWAKAACVTQALMVLQATAGEPWKSSYPSHTWVLVNGGYVIKNGDAS